MAPRLPFTACSVGDAAVATPPRGPSLTGCCGECAVVARLAEAHARIVLAEDGEADLQSAEGADACRRFVEELGSAAEALCCEVANRSYREMFTRNYRLLFPGATRCYRMDVLEACIEQLDSFWVNGEQYRLREHTLEVGSSMLAAWRRLGGCLQMTRAHGAHAYLDSVVDTMSCLDSAWACFERNYIFELIEIEETARGVIVEANDLDKRLRRAERAEGADSLKAQKARHRLAACVAKLNSVANSRRKGRDDLGVEVLEAALEILSGKSEALDASHAVAHQVLGAFNALREYFRGACACLQRVDPYLSNNAGLVERLVCWEEAWEAGHRYLTGPLRGALGSMVASIASARDEDPALAAMCDDCDPELFVVLPRVMWLAFLRNPDEHGALLRSALPEAFAEEGDAPLPGDDLAAFLSAYRRLTALLSAQVGDARRLLLSAAISEDRPTDGVGASDLRAMRRFLLELERWSMAAQRFCPEDWNACLAVILKVIGGAWALEAPAVPKFRI